jgi:2-amino-4-hydroxy-6-hydroxymethyldihydropteridine diphosphokinase
LLETVYIGLGANLKNPKIQIKNAIKLLSQHTQLKFIKTSSFYQSKPLNNMAQPNYINAVVKLSTSLKPLELLDVCQKIERQLGRIKAKRWASRMVDLDILLFGKKIIKNKRLTLPHYNMHLRGFVLLPLFEMDTNLSMPTKNKIVTLIQELNEIPKKLCPIILP